MSSTSPSLAPSSLHAAEDDSGVYRREARAKTIGQARHAFSAADLDAACLATATTTAALGRGWGVSETVARDVRSGKKPLTWDKIKALPKRVKEQLLRPELPVVDPRDERIEQHVVVLLELVRQRRGT